MTDTTNEELTIRPALPTDAKDLLALNHSVVEEGGFTLASSTEYSRSIDGQKNIIEDRASDPNELCLIALVGDELVGTISCESDGVQSTQHFVSLLDVWVRKDHRGRGIGKALLAELLGWATAHPVIEKVGLFVFSTSTAAIRLYESAGFELEGTGVGDMKFDDVGYVDTLIMGKWVKPVAGD